VDEAERSIQSLVIRYLVAHTQCSGCGSRYRREDVRIHEHRGEVWLASVTCSQCGLQGLVMAAIRGRESSSEETAADPQLEGCAPLDQIAPISGDEILDFHRFLAGFDGDVRQLLGEA